MTQAKAASLTSALFARKGAASPADLVIAELEEGADAKASTRKARSKERGGESAQRKKAKLPEVEQELPLLAFVDAQTSDEAVPAEELAAADHTLADPVRGEDNHPDPAASLMAHRPLAFGGSGSTPYTDDSAEVPASDRESLETETPAVAAAAEDEKAQQVAAEETAVAEAVAAVAQTDREVAEAVRLEEPEAPPVVQEDESQAIAASLPIPAKETPPSEAATDDEGTVPDVQDEGVKTALPEDGVASEDARAVAVPTDDVSTEAASVSTAAMPSDDSAPAELAGAKETSETAGRTVGSSASLLVESQDGERDTAAAASAAGQSVDPLADPKDREMPEAAAGSPTVLVAKRSAGLVGSPWRIAAVIALGVALGLSGYALWPEETTEPELAAVDPRSDSTEAADAAPQNTASQNAASNETGAPVVDAEVVQTAAGPVAPLSQPEPSFDIIRIEPNGQSIIAGRAEPFSQWILLNNGEPIGSVQADLNGEWVVLPDASLVPGANDFSLVPKTERGKVAIPAADEAPAEAIKSDLPESGLLAPRSERSSSSLEEKLAALGQDTALPFPRLKPAAGDATTASLGVRISPEGGYQIQIASVRQSAAAERERARLVDVYPGLLGALGLQVQEASIDGAGVFYRLRSGPIADLADARELCRQLELRGQSCLVVVRAGDDAVPNPSGINAVQPLAAPGLSSTQQAENPD